MKKTLYKSRKDRFLFGVCGGLVLYIVAAVVMPERVE